LIADKKSLKALKKKSAFQDSREKAAEWLVACLVPELKLLIKAIGCNQQNLPLGD